MGRTVQHKKIEKVPSPFYPNGDLKLVVIVYHVDYCAEEMRVRVSPVGWGQPTWWMDWPKFEGFPFEESVLSLFARVIRHGLSKVLNDSDRRSQGGFHRGYQKMNSLFVVSMDEVTWESVKRFGTVSEVENERHKFLLTEINNMVVSAGRVMFHVHPRLMRRELPWFFMEDGLKVYDMISANRAEVEGYEWSDEDN